MDRFTDKLSDYLDGGLDRSAESDVATHLGSCAECRETLSDLRSLKGAAASLERLEPSKEVWKRVAASIGAPRRTWWRPLLPVAAVLLVGTTAALLSLNLPLVSRPAALETQAPEAPAEWKVAEEKYESTLAGLEDIVTKDRSALDPKVADSLQTSLAVLDRAINESKAAAESEPADTIAQESLFEVLRRKLTLLENTVLLINDMRKGELDQDSLRLLQDKPKPGATKG